MTDISPIVLNKAQKEMVDLLSRLPWADVSDDETPPSVRIERSTYLRVDTLLHEGPESEEITISISGSLKEPPNARQCKTCGHYTGPSTWFSVRLMWRDGRFRPGASKPHRPSWQSSMKHRKIQFQKLIDAGHVL